MPRKTKEPDWVALVDEWDSIMAGIDRSRSLKLDFIMDLLDAMRFRKFTILDLGSGPGAFARRILERFPGSTIVAIDSNPVMLRVGEGALAGYGPRIQWIRADLRAPDWEKLLPSRKVDVALSSIALHGHRPEELRLLCKTLGRLLRRGGLYVDADWIPWEGNQNPFNDVADRIRELREERDVRSSRKHFGAKLKQWSARIAKIETLRELVLENKSERKREMITSKMVGLETHLRYLHDAGFRQATVMWQERQMRVLVAIR
jgi:trans-aconitate methyltransferase